MARYPQTYCSQCGREFGPGPHGYSHCKDHDVHWRDFEKMTDAQKAEAIALRPKWSRNEFRRFNFWIKPDGHVSRRSGHHMLTREADDELTQLALGKSVRTKGDLSEFITATFHTSKP